ncbi:noggin-2-like [Diretmus argenteus]
MTVIQDQKDTGWDLPFLQLKATLISYLQPIRPYSLLTTAEDYHYMPKPQHRRTSRLLRVLGPSFNPFWMSIKRPSEVSGVWTSVVGYSDGQPVSHGDTLPGSLPNYPTNRERTNLGASPELIEGVVNYRQKLEKEAADLDLRSLPSVVASAVRDWLVDSATCGLHYRWVDMGPVFWPRWLRWTHCEKSDGLQSCSFPSGMECMRAQTAHIKILAWHCWESEEGGEERRKRHDDSDGTTEVGTGEDMTRCIWRQVPYPVVTGCKCSCK